jgi:surfactin synthase thioesterase subunit
MPLPHPSRAADPPGWILCRKPLPAPRVRLFCFPYAGGGSLIYNQWAAALPDVEVCAVQLPGREVRLREPPIDDLRQLLTGIAGGLGPYLKPARPGDRPTPFAFFGHSFGALVAFELTRALRRSGAPLPEVLLVSGRGGPSAPQRHAPLHGIPGIAFARAVSDRYGGIPAALFEEPELLELLLPMVRADLKITEQHAYVDEPPLPVRIHVFGGDQDAVVAQSDLQLWRKETSRELALQMFPGGHFFVNDVRDQVLRAVREALAPI